VLLGLAPMDHTHREFVCEAQSLQRSSDAKLVDALQAMRNHCASHFARQDGSMSETDMPGRDYHADERAAVMQSVDEVRQCCARARASLTSLSPAR